MSSLLADSEIDCAIEHAQKPPELGGLPRVLKGALVLTY